jgi:hypothetical protein
MGPMREPQAELKIGGQGVLQTSICHHSQLYDYSLDLRYF